MEFILEAHQPFSYPAVVESHGWAQLASFLWVRETNDLGYILRLADGLVTRLDFGSAEDSLRVRSGESLNPAQQEEAAAAARWMFQLDVDLSPFYDRAAHEPKLRRVVHEARGRVLRSPTLFEDVIKTILTTNTQWGGTIRMVRELVQAYGDPLPADPALKAFPTPERLAAASPDEFASRVRLGYRAPYVLDLAQRVTSGELDLEALKFSNLPGPDLRRELLGIKGVGGYAAANLLMLLGRFDQIPVDSWAHKMVSQEFFGGEPVTPAQIEAVFAPWDEFKGLAYWFWEWSG
jgi:3-methyladenine DNA glycosylase/8-oxoguanine DNA glycosylase